VIAAAQTAVAKTKGSNTKPPPRHGERLATLRWAAQSGVVRPPPGLPIDYVTDPKQLTQSEAEQARDERRNALPLLELFQATGNPFYFWWFIERWPRFAPLPHAVRHELAQIASGIVQAASHEVESGSNISRTDDFARTIAEVLGLYARKSNRSALADFRHILRAGRAEMLYTSEMELRGKSAGEAIDAVAKRFCVSPRQAQRLVKRGAALLAEANASTSE
jgi:hypothetical protein